MLQQNQVLNTHQLIKKVYSVATAQKMVSGLQDLLSFSKPDCAILSNVTTHMLGSMRDSQLYFNLPMEPNKKDDVELFSIGEVISHFWVGCIVARATNQTIVYVMNQWLVNLHVNHDPASNMIADRLNKKSVTMN